MEEEIPTISRKDFEILKWHWAGKPHSWIMEKYNVSREYIHDLILKTSKGFRLKEVV